MEAEFDLEVLGGTIVVLDMPPGSAVGFDQYVYTVGDNFRGVKHVPPGTHVLSYAAQGGEGAGFGPVTASFVVVPTVELSGEEPENLPQDMEGWMKMSARYGPVMCWRWDGREEVLRKVGEGDDYMRIEQAVRSFKLDQGLGSYLMMNRLVSNSYRIVVPSWSGHREWIGLSKFVTGDVLDRVAPVGGNVCILAEGEYVVMEPSDRNSYNSMRPSEAERALEDQLRAGRRDEGSDSDIATSSSATDYKDVSAAGHAGKCYFTRIPGLVRTPGLTPEELTAANMDKSDALEQLLRRQYDGDEELMLGEYQFAFLAFLLGHSIDGFLQWKRILILMLGCEDAVMGARKDLFAKYLKCLLNQLSFCLETRMAGSRDVFQDAKKNTCGEALTEQLLEDTFLEKAISDFLEWILSEQCLLNSEVYETSEKIRRILHQRLRWECGPVPELPDGAVSLSGGLQSSFRSHNRDRPVIVVMNIDNNRDL